YISFRCTNKTVEEDIFVRKTYVELQGLVTVLPNLLLTVNSQGTRFCDDPFKLTALSERLQNIVFNILFSLQ
nr:hypothetical protein [Chlamydiota bacterium]